MIFGHHHVDAKPAVDDRREFRVVGRSTDYSDDDFKIEQPPEYIFALLDCDG